MCGAHPDGQDGLHRVRWVWGGSESAGAMPSSRERSALSRSSSSGGRRPTSSSQSSRKKTILRCAPADGAVAEVAEGVRRSLNFRDLGNASSATHGMLGRVFRTACLQVASHPTRQ